ncbi:MAG: LLM class flavin-dependent oxidoreductase [Dehalococcoidia bacterium]
MNFTVGMGRNLRADEAVDHARVAEECGFTHMTWVDQPNLSRDMYVSLTVAAMSTRRIRIGQGVTDPQTYHPSVIANATATLNELTGGRAFLGLGAGGRFGKVMKARPTQELREAIQFIRGYMAGEEAEYREARMHSEWSRRTVPIYLAVDGPKLCKLAGEIADGAIFLGLHPEIVKWRVEMIHQAALDAGRDPSEIDIWARMMIYVSDTKEAARREVTSYPYAYVNLHRFLQRDNPEIADLRQRLEGAEPGMVEELMGDSRRAWEAYDEYYHEHIDAPHAKVVSQRLIDFYHLTGPAEGICRRIEELGRLGVNTISTVLFTIIDKKGMMRKVSDEIMPHFRN